MQKGRKIWLALILGLLMCVSFAFGAVGVGAANYYNANGTAFSWSFDANGVSSQIPYANTTGTPVNARYGMEDPANNYNVGTDGSTFVVADKYIRMDLANGIDINKPFNVSFYVDANSGWTPATQNRYLTLSLFGSVDSLMAYNHTEWYDWTEANTSVLSIALAERAVDVPGNQGKILGGRGSSTSQPLPTSYGDLVRQLHSFTFYVGTGGADSSYIAYANQQTHTTTPYHANANDYTTAKFPEGKIYFAIGGVGLGMQIRAKISQPYSFVNFETNGGSFVAKQLLANGTTVTEPTNPTKSGWTFAGWYTDAGLTSAFNFTTAINTDTTLYAKWTQNGGGGSSSTTYTVSFDANGGTGSMAPVSGVSGNYTLPACTFTAPTGKIFKGWATTSTGTPISTTSVSISTNVTLYAIWGTDSATGYTISFNANGGYGYMAPVSGISGTYTFPPCTFAAPVGKVFDGWSQYAGGFAANPGVIEVNSDLTLYAIWKDATGTGDTGNNTGSNTGDDSSDLGYVTCGSVVFAPSMAGLLLGALGVVFAVKKKHDK